MSVLKILNIGNPLLRKKSLEIPVEEILKPEIQNLIQNMYDTMDFFEGVGLAAPQVGELKRLVVVGYEKEEDTSPTTSLLEVSHSIRVNKNPKLIQHVLINPKIKILAGPNIKLWEGCLSIPNYRGPVERVQHIKLEWLDEKAIKHEKIITGFPAVVYQHECDHLDGVLYVDHMKSLAELAISDELELMDEKVLD